MTPERFVENRIKKGADLNKIVSNKLTPSSLWTEGAHCYSDDVPLNATRLARQPFVR